MSPVLHLYTSATGAAQRLEKLVGPATRRGWDVFVIGTPQSEPFMDTAAIEKICGNQVSFHFRRPEESSTRQPADAAIFAGASFNTINKWAAGINDNAALGVLNEALGDGVPIVASPVAKPSLTAHPAFARSLDLLASAGVTFTATNAITSGASGELNWHPVLDAVANRAERG